MTQRVPQDATQEVIQGSTRGSRGRVTHESRDTGAHWEANAAMLKRDVTQRTSGHTARVVG